MKAIRVAVVLLVVIMAFSLCACKKVEEKIAEKSAEKLLEEALGTDVDITEDGGKIKVDGKSVESGENLPWPKEAMGDLPKPGGKITMVLKDEKTKSCTATISELEPDDASEYINMLKEMCIEEGILSDDLGLTFFSGNTDKGASIHFQYSPDDKEGLIAYSLEGLSNSISMPNTAADAGDNEAGSESSGYNQPNPAVAVQLPENYPEDIFPINKEDIITVAREHVLEDAVEYSLILESHMSTEEIVKYYKDKWGPIKDKYESVSATTFELGGTIKGYDMAMNGSLSDEDSKKVEYYIYVMEYVK